MCNRKLATHRIRAWAPVWETAVITTDWDPVEWESSWREAAVELIIMEKRHLFLIFLYFERNISWNFDGLATISLSLSHFIALFVSISSLKEMVSNSFPQAYRVVSSAKLQISVSLMKRSKSLIKILKRIGPSIDPCGIPRIISNHSLKDKPTFTLCCLWER